MVDFSKMPSALRRIATDGFNITQEKSSASAAHLSLRVHLKAETDTSEPVEDPIHRFKRPATVSAKSRKEAPGMSEFVTKFASNSGLAISKILSDSQFFSRTPAPIVEARWDSRTRETISCFQCSGATAGRHQDC